MKYQVLNQQGTKVKDLNLKDSVFQIEPHQQAIYEVVKAQRAAMRQGTHSVKGRSDVSGGGRKPYRQKGTGRARQGSIRAPHYVGGGVAFGPTPRKYNKKVNQKLGQLALRSALSNHALNGTLVIVDKLELEAPKTKEFAQILKNLHVSNKVLVASTNLYDELFLSARNINGVLIQLANHASVYDILNSSYLVLTEDAVKYFEEVLG